MNLTLTLLGSLYSFIFQLMAHLGVLENEIVLVRSTSLPKATFIKLQAHTKDFLHVSHPREL